MLRHDIHRTPPPVLALNLGPGCKSWAAELSNMDAPPRDTWQVLDVTCHDYYVLVSQKDKDSLSIWSLKIWMHSSQPAQCFQFWPSVDQQCSKSNAALDRVQQHRTRSDVPRIALPSFSSSSSLSSLHFCHLPIRLKRKAFLLSTAELFLSYASIRRLSPWFWQVQTLYPQMFDPGSWSCSLTEVFKQRSLSPNLRHVLQYVKAAVTVFFVCLFGFFGKCEFKMSPPSPLL